jgi:acyl-CoA synthetase (NDP forming)/GNAT superfamily N-acetyltransferase
VTTQNRPADTADALTTDGGIISIRPITSGDRRAITRLYADAAPENLRLRFFAVPGTSTLAAEIDRLCRPESDRFLALLAYEGDRLVGVASCERAGDGPRAEFAVFIADRDHGRGIGTLLLEHLTARARRLGVTELVGEVLPGNRDMLRVAHDLSPRAWAHFDRGIVDVRLQTGDDEQAQQAVDDRERTAEQASLQSLLRPRAIAIAGTGTGTGTGRETLRALRGYGFTGRLYLVDTPGTSIGEEPVHRSLRDLPEPIDLLVVAEPAGQVAAVLADGAAAGVRAAVVLSSGLGEGEAGGRRHLAGLLRLARSHGIRLVGPDSLGVLNTDPRVRLDACPAPAVPPAGGLGVAVRSATAATAILEAAARTGTGISTLVALGDEADVSGNDLIAYWYDDPTTHVVALHGGSVGDPRRFARTVRALSLRKPVLTVAGSLTPPGPGTAELSTACLDALFTRTGVIRTGTVDELLNAARMLAGQPLPGGRRLAVVSNDGELGRHAAVAARTAGLRIPALTGAPRRHVAALVPKSCDPTNPIDIGVGATPATVAIIAATVADSGTADMLLVVLAGNGPNHTGALLSALEPIVDGHPTLPVAVACADADTGELWLGGRRAPVYDSPEHAVRALAHASSYADWLRQPDGRAIDLPGIDAEQAGDAIIAGLAEQSGRQPYERTARILAAYGIAVRPADARPPADHVDNPLELVAGLVHDPLLGSLVVLGPGGQRARRPAERVSRLTPLTDLDARRMWRALPCAPDLSGRQGTPPADTTALEDLLRRLARLGADHPEIAALGLRLFPAHPNGLTVIDDGLRLSPIGGDTDPPLRRLPAP